MAAWDITAYEYDIPMEKLLHRRLEGHAYAVEVLPCGARVKLFGTGAAAVLADALTKVILRDLQYFVLARMTDAMPLALADKRQVLTDALYTARNREDEGPVRGELVRFLTAERALCLDGFLCFRMPETLMLWQLCVEQAASKVLLQKEYGELMQTLQSYVRSQRARVNELRLCLHRDGSCTLSDDEQLHIEYADGSPDGIVSLLVSMAPRRLVIVDRSEGAQTRLCDALKAVFSDRVEIQT